MDRGELNWKEFKFNNEGEFENLLLNKSVIDNYYLYDAKVSINSFKKYNRYADVLMINKDLKYWSIGECEVSSHSFSNHIFPQLIEIYNLMFQNLEEIRNKYINIENLDVDKSVKDLIMFNKPYLTLIIDLIPPSYSNIIPLLNSFCNVITSRRIKNNNEEYAYLNNFYYQKNILDLKSECFINDGIVLLVDNPNLLEFHNESYNSVIYRGKEIMIKQQNEVVNGINRLFWILDKSLNNGKYIITKKNNKLTIEK